MLNRTMPILIALTAQPVLSDLSSYLPLNVGNSWEYRSGYYENLAHEMPLGRGAVGGRITLSIDRTEEIDGKTYYVFSPWWKDWPLPPHALFGKKVRWEGDSLMVHDGTSEYPLYLVAVKARLLLTSGTDARDGDNGNTEDTYVEMTRLDVAWGRAGLPFTITNVPPSSWGNVKEERLYR